MSLSSFRKGGANNMPMLHGTTHAPDIKNVNQNSITLLFQERHFAIAGSGLHLPKLSL